MSKKKQEKTSEKKTVYDFLHRSPLDLYMDRGEMTGAFAFAYLRQRKLEKQQKATQAAQKPKTVATQSVRAQNTSKENVRE